MFCNASSQDRKMQGSEVPNVQHKVTAGCHRLREIITEQFNGNNTGHLSAGCQKIATSPRALPKLDSNPRYAASRKLLGDSEETFVGDRLRKAD
jgi:hypothetical protein